MPNVAKLLLDFIQAGLAEILAAKQFVFRASRQFAKRIDIEPLQRLPAPDGKFQISDVLAEDFRRNIPGRRERYGERRSWNHPLPGRGAGPSAPAVP